MDILLKKKKAKTHVNPESGWMGKMLNEEPDSYVYPLTFHSGS